MKVLIKELNYFWEFQANTQSKLDKVEEAIFTSKSKNDIGNVNNADFVAFLLKLQLSQLKVSSLKSIA